MGEASATAGIRATKVPIIIVPGILGSRLTDPANDELVWNPMGGIPGFGEPGDFAANTERMEQVNQPLVPDTTHIHEDPEEHAKVKSIGNYYNLIGPFYGKLARFLNVSLRRKLAPKQVVPKVFCCGYDFRVTNSISAQRLASIVAQARAECDGERAIIVAHSMGGLVSRHFCKNLNGEDQVRALFLLGSPTLGSPKAFHSLREGFPYLDVVRLILTPLSSSRRFVRQIPAVYQLLPSQLYGTMDPDWIAAQRELTGILPKAPRTTVEALQFSNAANTVLALQDIYAGLADDLEFRQLSLAHLVTAVQFHTGLNVGTSDTYMHPNTIVIFTDDLPTAGRFRIFGNAASVTPVADDMVVSSQIAQVSPVLGDETVPNISASPVRVIPPIKETMVVKGIKHDALGSDFQVIQRVMNRIEAMF